MIVKKLASSVVIVLLLFACQTVPITGRQQLHLIPSDEITAMSFSEYDKFLKTHKVITGTPETALVKKVGKRIQSAVHTYFENKNMAERLEGYEWEFNLVDEDQANAWAMPGGKVVVYKGILPVTRNEQGLAVVMGHEIAHAIANHGNERMSQGLLVQMGGVALSVALSEKPAETRQLYMAAFGLGSTVGVMLPFSRLHESEADHLGLIFMAMAGYDPRGAVDFWKRMAEQKGGASPPEFLSTHPADETRIRNIEKLIPEALQYYQEP